jgi:hypothetical protein
VTDASSEAPRRFSRRTALAAATIAIIATLLYLEWFAVRPAGGAEQDTMCLVSRIGLPCR